MQFANSSTLFYRAMLGAIFLSLCLWASGIASATTTLTGAEYFIDPTPWLQPHVPGTKPCEDNDPGVGQGTPLPPTDGSWNSVIEAVRLEGVDPSQLPLGIHDLCVRFKDSNGHWGTTRFIHFTTVQGLTACEYYIDSDPGPGFGKSLPPQDGVFDTKQEALRVNISTAGLSVGTHTIGARCKDGWGRWGPRPPTTVTVNVTPKLRVLTGNTQVTLNWDAVTGATSYNVYQGTTSGSEAPTPVMTGITGTSVTIPRLTNSTTYFFKIAAVEANGVISPLSNEVSATPVSTLPVAPVICTMPGNTQVTLHWNAVPGATSYNVYQGTTSGGEVQTTPVVTGITGTSYTIPGLTNSTTYFFEMAAVNTNGTSALSNEVVFNNPHQTETIFIDFGPPYGIWQYSQGTQTWSKIHNLSADQLVAADLDGNGQTDLVVNFGNSYGTWVLMNNQTWVNLHPLSPVTITAADLDSNGMADLVVNFGDPYGTWRWMNNQTWWKLLDLSPVPITAANLDGNCPTDLVVNFGDPDGTRVWMNNQNWMQLHHLSAVSITAADLDGNGQQDLVIDFGQPYGIWRWMNNHDWAQLHHLSAVSITAADLDGNGQDDVVINFGPSYGLWVWMNNQSWVKLHNLSPASVTAAYLDNNIQQDLVIDFGTPYGIWMWMNNNKWVKLHNLSAQHIVASPK
jgi:hypothetical protein